MTHRMTVLAVALTLALSGCAAKQLRVDLASAEADQAACQEKLTTQQKQLDAAKAAARSAEALASKRIDAYRDLAKKLREAFGSDDIPIELRNGRLVVLLPNQILFDSGKTALKPDGKKALDHIASVLKTVPDRRFMVAGHTDDRPVSDKATEFKTNWELSTQRALAGLYHMEKAGIASNRMAAAGYGQHQPVVANSSEANRAKNRRTEIVILPNLDEIPPMPKSL